MDQNKLITLILLGIFFISFVSATESLGTFQKDKTVRITQVCNDATYITITSVSYPNSSTAITLKNMSSLGSGEFYLDFTNTSTLGRYEVRGTSNGCSNSFATYFTITNTGNDLNTSQMLLYIFIGVVLIFLFVLCVWGGIIIPFENARNGDGEVIKVNWKKYLKVFCWSFSYALLIAIVFVAYNLIWAYAQWGNLAIFFRYLHTLLMVLALPVFASIIILGAINYLNDKKIAKFIKQTGLPYGE